MRRRTELCRSVQAWSGLKDEQDKGRQNIAFPFFIEVGYSIFYKEGLYKVKG
jgi:hypothetical protein